MLTCHCAFLLLVAGVAEAPASVRTWTDASGEYSTEAALVDFDSQTVVLKKHSGKLVAVPIAKLLKADQDYLHSQAATQAAEQHSGGNRTWTLRDGNKFVGHVLKYGRAKVVVQRQYGKIVVADKPFQNITKPHQYVLFKIIEHFDRVPVNNMQELENWAIKQRGEPREFDCEGVLMQVEDGEKFAVPFFLFSPQDEKFLRPGWDEWLAVEAKASKASQEELAKQQQSELFLRARARDYQRDQAMQQMVEMTSVAAGLVDEWQVLLVPGPGVPGTAMQVVVPARDSQSARREAMARNPNYVATQVVRINRRSWR